MYTSYTCSQTVLFPTTLPNVSVFVFVTFVRSVLFRNSGIFSFPDSLVLQMEGPDIQGPQIWLDLNRKAEAKILDYHKANLERLKWLDQYVEECKLKLGVQVSEEPSFVPKVININT